MNDNEVFWLARYAHNTLAPLFKEAQAIEPSIKYTIEMHFYNPEVRFTGSIGVYAHWDRPGMFLHTLSQKSKADIDTVARSLREKLADLKAEALLPT